MDVFISWSGELSRAAAEALRGWLPKIINAIKPWLSSEDIDKGARWSTDVATRLEAAKAGIICLTPSNLHSDWILFEAGALSKTLKNTFVCPFLIGLEPSDVKPPLAQFQATRAAKEDVLKLLKTLNTALGDSALAETHIDEAFDVWWPKLESKIKALPPQESITKTHRPDRELLEEILSLVRNQGRLPKEMPASVRVNEQNVKEIRDFLREEVIKKLIEVALQNNGEKIVPESYKRDGELRFVRLPRGRWLGITVADDLPEREIADEISAQVKQLVKATKRSGTKREEPI